MSRVRSRVRSCAVLAALCVLALGGCVGSRTVKGKVVLGSAGVATVVSTTDPRLDDAGQPGVTVRVMRGEGPDAISEAVSGADGSFSLRVPEGDITRRLEIQARGDSIMPLRTSAYLPMDDRRLLVIVESGRSMGESGLER